MIIILVWLILSALVGMLANSRGRSGIGFGLLSIITSPLLGLIIVLVLQDLAQAAREESLHAAAAERETVRLRKEHERHIEEIRAIGRSSTAPSPQAGWEKTCPFCAETIKAAAKVCKHCGRDLP